ncbi:RNA 2',3'-cyclic phosphodiesterase [Atopococcus tabaci]|uniref:RNA 2',3'-cyclic phosphodiesterase n=1 Tax=Atopococcus tabaci TaxID=269774 RepID=UPI0003F8290C|nr:RNA 2',3'-cyclic phosphodiesterase [Atopococcus tabaci]
MRLFIAIDLDESVKKQLLDVQQQLKSSVSKGRFSRVDHFHLTLRFIGETPEETLPLIHNALSEAVQEISPFRLTLAGIGQFQKRKRLVLWVGVEDNPLLMELQTRIDAQLEKWIDLPLETRPYTPHITLGRNVRLDEEWEAFQQRVSVPHMNVEATKVTLFQSTQIDGRLRYLPLVEVQLRT